MKLKTHVKVSSRFDYLDKALWNQSRQYRYIVVHVYIYILQAEKVIIPAATNWVKVNLDNTGFYRVKYSSALWDGLIEQLKNNHSVSHHFYTRSSSSLAFDKTHRMNRLIFWSCYR